MGDYSMPSWSYSENWDTYLSESGAWNDPDILTVDVSEGNCDWVYEISLSVFNGKVTYHEGMLEFHVKFDGWNLEMPMVIRVPMYSSSLWKHEGRDPKKMKMFEPYFGQNWEIEIKRDYYKALIELMEGISDEWSEEDDTVKFDYDEQRAQRDSYFEGQPSWSKNEEDIMYFELDGNIRFLIAERLKTELEFMFQGYPETI